MIESINNIYNYYENSCYKVENIEFNKTYYKSIHDLLFESLDDLVSFYSDIEECNIKDYDEWCDYLIDEYFEDFYKVLEEK